MIRNTAADKAFSVLFKVLVLSFLAVEVYPIVWLLLSSFRR
jgi:hypothetical protein